MATVAEDKILGTNDIKVFPIEFMSEHEGNINDEEDKKVMSNDESMGTVQSTTKKSVTLNAQWVNIGGSNRITAPDVMKGETVLLFKYGSSDKYYWTTFFTEPDLRRREAVLELYGNETEFGKILNKENSYWKLIDTVNKVIHLHTSDNDGELTTYDFILDTKNGSFSITDGRKNQIILNSKKDHLTLNVPNITITGGKVNFDSTVSFNKAVKMNGNASTDVKSGTHGHTVL